MTPAEALQKKQLPAGEHGDFSIASNVAWEAARALKRDVHLCRVGNRYYVSPGMHDDPSAVERWRVSPDGMMKEYVPCTI